eukprot:jgi/Psemu1/66233/estExt_Genemark1.C_1890027
MVLSTTRRTTPLGAKAIGPQGDYRGVRSPTGTSARVLPTQDSKTSNKPAIETVVARLWAAGLEETIPHITVTFDPYPLVVNAIMNGLLPSDNFSALGTEFVSNDERSRSHIPGLDLLQIEQDHIDREKIEDDNKMKIFEWKAKPLARPSIPNRNLQIEDRTGHEKIGGDNKNEKSTHTCINQIEHQANVPTSQYFVAFCCQDHVQVINYFGEDDAS